MVRTSACISKNKYLISSCESFEYLFAEIIQKYSNFVGFPIYLNGACINTIQVSIFSISNCFACFFFLVGLYIYIHVHVVILLQVKVSFRSY